MRPRLTSTLLLLFLALPLETYAQWQPDGAAVVISQNGQDFQGVTSDGAGGAIFVWEDYRSNFSYDIYAQRINGSGVAQWPTDGVPICTLTSDQYFPTVAPDGSGGAFIAWQDYRSGPADIYIQRVNSAGVPQWTNQGVQICGAMNTQYYARVVADGAGGAIVVWQDLRNGVNYDIYAQRVNSAGVPQWTANGVPLCVAANNQQNHRIVPDGAGGAIVSWEDPRSGTADIYAQRVNSAGVVQWTVDGVLVCNAANGQNNPMIAQDGANGAIIVWQDFRNGSNYDLYAQRLNGSGAALWYSGGFQICSAAGDQTVPVILGDGAGGSIIAWQDQRTVAPAIYVQRLNSGGTPQWALNGVAVVNSNYQYNPTIASDGAGGAVVGWEDYRSGTNYDIYAQRVSAGGAIQWAPAGTALCTAANNQAGPAMIADGAGGVITVFLDGRTGYFDIYAQRVTDAYGYWGHPEPVVVTVADIPHDQGGKVKVNWTASGRDLPVPSTIGYYSIWRAVDVSPSAPASSPVITPLEHVKEDTPAGAITTMPQSSYYWELVGTQKAFRYPAYSFSADTRADSIAGAVGNEAFMVAAHDRGDELINFTSNVLTGHSVDNLAPTPPLLLTAQRTGSYVYLKWNGVHVCDLRDYAVYRKTSSGVTAIPINFLSSSDDTLLTDTNPPAGAAYYIVTAYDVHANQSSPSNEAAVGAASGAGNLPPIATLTLLQTHPNPFTGTTSFDVGLPVASHVSLEVFDVAGRRVAARSYGQKPAGWQSLSLDAVGDDGKPLASGVYFYRITAAGKTLTRKMVIAR